MEYLENEFSFSPKSMQNIHKSLMSLRSADDTDSYMNSPRSLLEQLFLKQERHEALKNYYLTVMSQLKDFHKVSLQQLSNQKFELMEKIEERYQNAVQEVKERALQKEQELREKYQEADEYYEQVSEILKKMDQAGNDKGVIKEAEDNLKLWASEVDVTDSNLMFTVPSLAISGYEYGEYKAIGKNIKISSIRSDSSPLQTDSENSIKIYVPFGFQEYYYYYFLQITQKVKCSALVSALEGYLGMKGIVLLYRQAPNTRISPNEDIHPDTQSIYLTLDLY